MLVERHWPDFHLYFQHHLNMAAFKARSVARAKTRDKRTAVFWNSWIFSLTILRIFFGKQVSLRPFFLFQKFEDLIFFVSGALAELGHNSFTFLDNFRTGQSCQMFSCRLTLNCFSICCFSTGRNSKSESSTCRNWRVKRVDRGATSEECPDYGCPLPNFFAFFVIFVVILVFFLDWEIAYPWCKELGGRNMFQPCLCMPVSDHNIWT